MNANAKQMWDDIDFDYPDGPNAEMPPVVVADQDQAEAHLRALDAWRAQAEQIEAHAQREIDRVQRWRDEEMRKVAPRIAYHESGLVAYLMRTTEAGKGKTVRLIHGTLKRVAGQNRVEERDINALKTWCEKNGHDFLRTKYEAKKPEIHKHIKSTGELPDGVELVPGEDSFKIETD